MARRDSVIVLSSSPEFPSICDLLPRRKPTLRSGSNAAPVPQDAPTAFTSAASIWQSLRTDDMHDSIATDPATVTTTRSPTIPAVEPGPDLALTNDLDGARGAKKRSKSGGTKKTSKQSEQPKTDHPAEGAAPVQKRPRKKPVVPEEGALAQTTLPKGKVTKPAARAGKPKRKAETVSKHFVSEATAVTDAPSVAADQAEDELILLEPAMRRRMDWTPPPESAPRHCLADSPMLNEPSSTVVPANRDVFGSLQDAYGRRAGVDSGANVSAVATADVLGKRKLVEMVGSGHRQKTPEASPAKPKAVKKRPRTITELATAAYRQPEAEPAASEEQNQQSLLGYLGNADAQSTVAVKTVGEKGKGAKRPAKPKSKPAKKGEGARKQMLLSPRSAMRQVSRQDFVFGTASQLATEDDPELLRALHAAMEMSNRPDGDPFASSSPAHSDLAIRRRAGAKLWAAGARGDDGDLLTGEVLDLTRSSPSQLNQFVVSAPAASQSVAAQQPPTAAPCIEIDLSDDTLDISTSPPVARAPVSVQASTHTAKPLEAQPERLTASAQNQERPSTPVDESDLEPPPSNQEQHQLLLSQVASPRPGRTELPPRPNFELFTDARLAKEVASYGFKPVKKRTAMIALLAQCWTSQTSSGLLSKVAQASMSTKQGASPRPGGRPREIPEVSVAEPAEPPAPTRRGRKHSVSGSDSEAEVPSAAKRPRGRPRKSSAVSVPEAAEAAAPSQRARKVYLTTSDSDLEVPKAGKRPRGRPRKDSTAASLAAPSTEPRTSPKRAKSPPKKAASAPAPTTPKRRQAAPKPTVLEIADSESDDPFASSPISSPGSQDGICSPPAAAMDLSVTEDTETSLMASPTSDQVSLFRYITQAVISAPRSRDPADPSWHEKMLMYDPVILEDLTAWLNAGPLDRVGYDGEVAPGDVKKWCESKSVCCLWRVNLRGKERKRL